MWLTLRAMALVLFVSVCVRAQTRTLAVYSDTPQDLDAGSTAIMHGEVQRLLAPAGFDIVWKKTTERKAGEDFEAVVVASFEGSCSTVAAKTIPVAAVSLADTSISDGRILPFFRVDCRRLSQLLGPQADSSVIGRALGRVMAHEIYHIVARTTQHHDTGVAKPAFSSRDLLSARFDFDAWSLARMRPPSVARIDQESSENAGR